MYRSVYSARRRLDRVIPSFLPTASFILIAITAREFLEAPFRDWDAVRLVPAFAMARGLKLYYPPDQGPVLDMMYGPVVALAYLPAAIFPTPTAAVIFAKLFTVLFFFGPAAWLLWEESRLSQVRERLYTILCFLSFCYFTVDSPVLSGSAFWNHADAPGLCFAALACGLLIYRRVGHENRYFFLSSLFAALSIWTKHVTISLIAALPLYVWMTEGPATARRYLVWLFGTLGAVSGLFIGIYGAWPLWFNLIQNPGHQPFQHEIGIANGRAIREFLVECRWVAFAILFYPLYQRWVLPEQAFSSRRWLRDNHWSIFVIVAILTFPFSLVARVKIGGASNSFSFSYYFMAIATILILIKIVAESTASHAHVTPRASKLIVVLLILGSVVTQLPTLTYYYMGLSTRVKNLKSNPQEEAFLFEKNHPGDAYFPWNLLSQLLASGSLYNFDYALYDRDESDGPVTQSHFNQYVPAHMKYVAYSPQAQDQFAMKYLPEFNRKVELPELPGWTVYAKAEGNN